MEDPNYSFFSPAGKFFSSVNVASESIIAFKDHSQFSVMVDVLARKEKHHLHLVAEFLPKFYRPFLEALSLHLRQENIPHLLRESELIYIDLVNMTYCHPNIQSIENDFKSLHNALDHSEKYLLIAMSEYEFQEQHRVIKSCIESLLIHPKCRILFLSMAKQNMPFAHYSQQFTVLALNEMNETDIFLLLKQQKVQLENFHQILIPDDLLQEAYLLAERYLSTVNTLEKALLLLDSSAARTRTAKATTDKTLQPVLTVNTLKEVLSGWVDIPVTHLHLQKFKLSEFIHRMQQRVFGQETALTLLAHHLQQSQARLQQNLGPFAGFLFVGPAHAGKRTTAMALTEQLFKQLNTLYFVTDYSSNIMELVLQRCLDKRYFALKDVIHETPYAVIVFENIDQAPQVILEGLQEIFNTGFLHDQQSQQYNFRQAILILTTTQGSNLLVEIAKSFSITDETENVDLMQLVMNEQKHEITHYDQSPHELANEITPVLTSYLPASLCQYLRVIPFLPLNKQSIEQIIKLKLNVLTKQLDARYAIELSYAPEVIRYLANEVIMKKETEEDLFDVDKAIKQLYFVVEQAILTQADNKNRPHQLFLQLNETGQLLRCDWLFMTPVRQTV